MSVSPRALLLSVLLLPRLDAAAAAPLVEPPTLSSVGGTLDVLVVARPQRLADFPGQPVGCVFVSLEVPPGTGLPELQKRLGRKMKLVTCSGIARSASERRHEPVCAARLLMMPSSRVEIAVAGRSPKARTAILRTHAWSTGDSGDIWPGVELASVRLPASTRLSESYLRVRGESARAVEPSGILGRTVNARRSGGRQPSASRCAPLPPGKVRQIIFGIPAGRPHDFGLAYREAEADQPLRPSFGLDITTFDHAAEPTVCVPLGPGDRPVTETWELVNVSGEDHNFHIHQARFELLRTEPDLEETVTPTQLSGVRVLHDNVPLPHGAAGCDGTIATWARGACVPSRVVVQIRFNIVGDFVYHCHILSHEDGGMMSKISVVPHR
jgi:L-ascorbate oxidase